MSFTSLSTGGRYITWLNSLNLPAHSHDMPIYTTQNEAIGFGLNQTPSFKDRVIVTNYGSIIFQTKPTGSGEGFNIQNPYIAVYFWRRIS